MPNQSSFDLEKAISTWRAELACQPGLTPADLRELEIHLRDAFAEFKVKGFADEEAFQLASKRVGPSGAVAAEFAKAAPGRVWAKRLFWLVFGLFLFASYVDIMSNFYSLISGFLISIGVVQFRPEHVSSHGAIFELCSVLFGCGVAAYWLVRGVPRFLARATSSRLRVAGFGVVVFLITFLARFLERWVMFREDSQGFRLLAIELSSFSLIHIGLLLAAICLVPSPGNAAPWRFWRQRVFWGTFLVVYAVFISYLLSATPEYAATASIKIVRSDASANLTPQEVEVYIHQFQSRGIAQRVADLLSPADRRAFMVPFSSQNLSNTDASLVRCLLLYHWAGPGRRAYILQVNVEHPDPHLAAIVADAFAQAFVEIQNADPQLAANGRSFQSLSDASGSVIQSEPKSVLLLVGGFFFGLLSAFAMTLLALAWNHLRLRTPPSPLAA